MLLISPSSAAVAIGAKCGGSNPDADDPALLAVLNLILPRVEGAMNVHSLVRGRYRDHFYLPCMPTSQDRPESLLLLSNGYLPDGDVTVTAPDGTITEAAESVNRDEGVVRLYSWSKGVYTVEYDSGFEVAAAPEPPPEGFDPETLALLGVPAWIQGITIGFLVMWFRSVHLKPKMPKDTSFAQVDNLLRREIVARVYEKYMRPRVGVTFSEQMDRVS